MFPLKERIVSGYRFSQPTFYSAHHLGTDWKASYVPLYAPFDGVILEAFTGVQGGKTLWFKPNHDNVVMRFLHLDSFNVVKGAKVRQGEHIATTGNTGKLTTGEHLHMDISEPPFQLVFPGTFTDPELYNWDWVKPEPVPVPITFWIAVDAPAGAGRFRDKPNLYGAIMVEYPNGTQVECIETVEGDTVSVREKDGTMTTSSKWYKSKKSGWFVSAAIANHN
jgi:hypothetical protein